jgi:hypothetical protein
MMIDETVEPTNLDAPPTPWEEDDPWADQEEAPSKSPWEIGQEVVEMEEKKLEKELEGITIEQRSQRLRQEWEDEINEGWFAVVAMHSTTYTGAKASKKTVKLDHLPRPKSLEWVNGRQNALDRAKEKASLVLEMSPQVRKEFMAFNVCGPYKSNTELPENHDSPMHDRPEKRRTIYIVSTRVYKKGTKECQVSVMRPVDSIAPHGDFKERFPGGRIPIHDIMAAANKAGVGSGMQTLLASHMDENEIAKHFPGANFAN